jgi:hypothetical protein
VRQIEQLNVRQACIKWKSPGISILLLVTAPTAAGTVLLGAPTTPVLFYLVPLQHQPVLFYLVPLQHLPTNDHPKKHSCVVKSSEHKTIKHTRIHQKTWKRKVFYNDNKVTYRINFCTTKPVVNHYVADSHQIGTKICKPPQNVSVIDTLGQKV